MPHASLASLLFRFLDTPEPKRLLDDYLHVSDLFKGCMRQVYLAKKEEIVITERIPPATRMKFAVGNAVESILCGWFKNLAIFDEGQPLVKDDDLKIQGHPDLRIKNGKLVEIKAMDPALFKIAKRRPLPHHEFQVQTYLWLDKTQEAILFSATWGSDKVPFNDLTVRYNVKVGEAITRTVVPLREAEAGGPLPLRVCETQEDKRAVMCPVRERCFKEDSLGIIKTAGELAKG